MKRLTRIRTGIRFLIGLGLKGSVCAAVAYVTCWIAAPFPDDLLTHHPAATQWLDQEGNPLRLGLGPGDLDCRPIPLTDASPWAGSALIAAEDQRFESHSGIDPVGLGRAVLQNAYARRVVSGASTISTQVIRLAEPRPRHFGTKLIETLRAQQMEQKFDKDFILEQYLNRAPFGSNVVGIEAASQTWLGKPASNLTLAEASLLMGLPQSPARFRPDRHLDAAVERRTYVLERLGVLERAPADALHQAAELPLTHVKRHRHPFRSPHFVELVQSHHPEARGKAVQTSLDPIWQNRLRSVLSQAAPHLSQNNIHGAAIVVLDVKTGQVAALLGSPDYFDEEHAGQVNVAWNPRSSGSTLKPFLVAQAMDAGISHPDRRIADVPMVLRDYAPLNADGHYRGLVTTRNALVHSLNLPFLRLAQDYGIERLLPQLRATGLSTLSRPAESYGLSLITGTAEVRLLELVNAYAIFAREGRFLPYSLLDTPMSDTPRAWCSPGAAWLVSDMLSGPDRSLLAWGHQADAPLPRFAWKTGTSMGHRDAFAIGWNPEVVIGVWLGNPDGTASPALVGAQTAGPVLHDLFRAAWPRGDGPWFPKPASIQTRPLCAVSGGPAGPHCEHAHPGAVLAGRTDPRTCSVHQRGPQAQWPADIAAGLERLQQDTAPKTKANRLVIAHPVHGARYRLAADTPPPSVSLRAKGQGPRTLYWFHNGVPCSDQWTLTPGTHTFRCVTESGHAASATVVVEPPVRAGDYPRTAGSVPNVPTS